MIQNKYPGLVTNFRKGYKELVKRDFFGIGKKSKPLLELGLVDRLNIYAKTKDENIIFLDDEKWIFDDIEKMTTWEDAINLAEKLAKYMEDNLESQGESVKASDDLMDSEDSGDSEDSDSEDSEDSGDSDLILILILEILILEILILKMIKILEKQMMMKMIGKLITIQKV